MGFEVGGGPDRVISPLLANLFLHYAFDRWMDRTHRGVPFERYADDIVIHCTRMSEAVRIRESLTRRMSEVGLTINEEKSKIVYIYLKDVLTHAPADAAGE
jgi:retron-type reverse transcriptase